MLREIIIIPPIDNMILGFQSCTMQDLIRIEYFNYRIFYLYFFHLSLYVKFLLGVLTDVEYNYVQGF